LRGLIECRDDASFLLKVIDDVGIATAKALDRHRGYFAKRMPPKKWYIDSAVLNAVEATRHATASAIAAVEAMLWSIQSIANDGEAEIDL
jgi:hypothetical protein